MMLLQAARAVEPLICLASTQSSDVQTKHYCIALSVASLVSDLGTSRHGKLTTAASLRFPVIAPSQRNGELTFVPSASLSYYSEHIGNYAARTKAVEFISV